MTERERKTRARARNKKWQQEHPDKVAAATKRWREKNLKHSLAKNKAWRKKNPNYQREWRLKNPERHHSNRRRVVLRQYRMTEEEYKRLLKKQHGHCAFPGCKATEFRKGMGDSLAVDHNHRRKKNRGLLCYRHNILIGLALESIVELRAAISYLRRHK